MKDYDESHKKMSWSVDEMHIKEMKQQLMKCEGEMKEQLLKCEGDERTADEV